MSSPKSPVFELTEHPIACPKGRASNSSSYIPQKPKVTKCPGVFIDVPRKSGLGDKDGRWKIMCSIHGMIYYNLSEKQDG